MKINGLSDSMAKRTGDGSSLGLKDQPKNSHELAAALHRAAARCREQRKQWTPHRQHLFTLLLQSDKPLSAYELLAQLNGLTAQWHGPPIVYRGLKSLLELGLIHRLEHRQQYVACTCTTQPHEGLLLVCTQCERVFELPTTVVDDLIHDVVAAQQFQRRSGLLEISGLCIRCQTP